MKLTGQTILITGGASGIGLSMTEQLVRLGNMVIITGRNESRLNMAKERFPSIHTIKSDEPSST